MTDQQQRLTETQALAWLHGQPDGTIATTVSHLARTWGWAPEKPLDACTPAARREGRVAAQCCATTRRPKAMSTDVYERINSQITNELESGALPRLKPWNAAYAKERITHPLRGTSRANVKGVSHAAA